MLGCQSRWLCDPDVVVAMAREDMQGFKRYVKQEAGREWGCYSRVSVSG